jgi:hypothetical protein
MPLFLDPSFDAVLAPISGASARSIRRYFAAMVAKVGWYRPRNDQRELRRLSAWQSVEGISTTQVGSTIALIYRPSAPLYLGDNSRIPLWEICGTTGGKERHPD